MGSAGTPSQGGVVVRGDSYRRGRRQRTNLIRQPPLMQATPPHPPSCTGDGGRHDVHEDPFPRSAMSTRSSLAPEDRPLLRSASPTVASARSTCLPRPLHDPASCRRPYPFEVTRHPLDAHHHLGSCHGRRQLDLSLKLTTREARTRRGENRSQTAAGPPRDTFGRGVKPSARNRLLPAALQLRGWDSNPQPTD
jgi:hypothetical protein